MALADAILWLLPKRIFTVAFNLNIHFNNQHMLQAIELTKQYGDKTALDRLNLSIAPGEIYCMLGANGAGKTTTINLFMGFVAPTSGKAIINGMEVKPGSNATKSFIAYIPEQVMLYPTLTGTQN